MFIFQHNLIYVIPCIIIAFTVHEYFHAYVSYRLGDNQAKNDGRLTLNPIKHIDVMGFVFLLALGFGWAKPVMVNPNAYKNPRKGTMMVALAGPLSNLVIAIVAIILNIIFKQYEVSMFFFYLWMINLGLCIFNLIPIPPLDGSKVIGYFMSANSYQDFLKNQWIGFVLLIVMIYMNIFSYIMNPIFSFVVRLIYGV